jgi:hypothetical protein
VNDLLENLVGLFFAAWDFVQHLLGEFFFELDHVLFSLQKIVEFLRNLDIFFIAM